MQWLPILSELVKHIKIQRKKNILIVEDNADDIFMLRRYLDKLTVNVDVAQSGEDARGTLSNKKYSIVFIDIRLVNMDGIALIKHIKDVYPKTKNVIVLGQVEDLVKFPTGTFISLIIKPITFTSISETLKTL